MQALRKFLAGLGGCAVMLGPAWAHDPIFAMGPHVVFKKGVEIASELHGPQGALESGVELTYGVSGDWAVGGEWSPDGAGDSVLFSKHRFWRRDGRGIQESAAWALRGVRDAEGARGVVTGLAYGYESRRWYRWASLRYGRKEGGRERLWMDLVGGVRPRPRGYLQPDAVWLLELNGERTAADAHWFLSPGLFWTYRNFALKTGLQWPLNGSGARGKLVMEWHL